MKVDELIQKLKKFPKNLDIEYLFNENHPLAKREFTLDGPYDIYEGLANGGNRLILDFRYEDK